MQRQAFGLLAALLLVATPATAGEEKQLPLDQFTRVVERKEAGDVLQCSIRVYSPPPPSKGGASKLLGPMANMFRSNKPLPPRPKVVLVSMIHIGEKGFYAAARKALAECDLVLYEEQGDEAMAGMSGAMIASVTGLASQAAEIPRDPKTWRSADLSMEQLFRMMGIHPDVLKQMERMSKSMGGMKVTPQMLESNPMLKQMLPDRKKLIAQMRGGGGSLEGSLGGGDTADMVLHQRNAIIMGELTKATHEEHKTVAVIYGAAHMPAVDAYLRGRLGYKLEESSWLNAVYEDEKESKAAPAPAETPEQKPEAQPKEAPKAPEKKKDDWF
ncbi:MAG: hypothetical protein AB7N76_04735 [Planctomycetota bacterium]